MKNKKTTKKIGLALGSGGFRGFAHLGVIRGLEENKVPISFISGSSIGSLVAAYYAIYGEINSLEEKFTKYKNQLFSLPDFNLRGKLNTPSYYNFIKYLFGKKSFSQTTIPLRIVATNLLTGDAYIYSKGSIASAVRASSSVPIIFEPLTKSKASLVDGALSSPVPTLVLKNLGAKKIIAVNLYHQNEFKEKNFTLTKVALKSIRIALYNLAKNDIKNVDILINPDLSYFLKKLPPNRYFSEKIAKEITVLGYEATIKKRGLLKKL